MVTGRKIDYPAKLDEIAADFGVSTSELLEEIASGELMIVRRPSEAELAADDALWDAQFAASQDFLDKLAEETLAQYHAGLTEEFDPDTDTDFQ
jgi:hypothetical protein